MKAHAFAELLDLLGPYEGLTATAISAFAQAFRNAPATSSLAVAVNKLVPAMIDPAIAESSGRARISDAITALDQVNQVVRIAGTKADAAATQLLAESASKVPNASVDSLANAFSKKKTAPATRPKIPKPPNVEVIDRYVAQLRRQQTGTQGFEQVLQLLKDDSAAKAGEMKLIAIQLGHAIAETATRAASLKVISRAHRIVYETAAKVEAMKGQSAT